MASAFNRQTAVREARAWVTALLAGVPGGAGYRLRRSWMPRVVAQLGAGGSWGVGISVIAGERIHIGESFSMDDYGRLCAIDGMLTIGSRAALNRNVLVDASNGEISIGNDVLVGPNVILRSSDHVFSAIDRPINQQGHRSGRIVIEDDVWIAGNVTVTGGVCIGAHAVIGAGAVVTRDVAPWTIAGGVPARPIEVRTRV